MGVQSVYRSQPLETGPAPANDREPGPALRMASIGQIGPAVWDAFVMREPSATFFHLSRWQKVVSRVYGLDTHYLAVVSGGKVQGVLPLVHVRSRLFGNSLISNAFCVYGGIAASNDIVKRMLVDAAVELGAQLGVDYVELRCQQAQVPDWPVKSAVYATFQRPLFSSADDNLKAIPWKKRADVRKAIKADLRVDTSGDLDEFYSIYAESVHKLGTPVFPKRFIQAIKEEFGDACEVSVVHGPDGPVAALTSFYFRDQVLPYYGGGVAAARGLHAYEQLYWSLMCRASARGAGQFDFGRSKYGTGAFDYKTHWGFEPKPLEYQYHLVQGAAVPDINPLNPKYRMMVAAWQKLPGAVANRLGPWLSGQLG